MVCRGKRESPFKQIHTGTQKSFVKSGTNEISLLLNLKIDYFQLMFLFNCYLLISATETTEEIVRIKHFLS